MESVKTLYERLRALPWPALAGSIGDFPLYESLIAGCADRAANGHDVDAATLPRPDAETLTAVAALRAKPTLTAAERAFLEYFELVEQISSALKCQIENGAWRS